MGQHADRPEEACGVVGIHAPGVEASNLAYYGLFALQHRGQESAGIAVSEGSTIVVYKDMGLVSQVFDQQKLSSLSGHIAIGHVRYSTTGSSLWENAQPTYKSSGGLEVVLGHNGNLVNTMELAGQLNPAAAGRVGPQASTDSDLVAELIAGSGKPTVEEAILD